MRGDKGTAGSTDLRGNNGDAVLFKDCRFVGTGKRPLQ